MTLYDTIFVRRSVRRYNGDPISDEMLEEILDRIDGLEQMNGQKATFKVVQGKKAPYAVLAYCEDGLEEYVNAGYCLQEVDLYLQGLGLGSLWFGSRNPTKNGKDGHCITLAFGNTDVPFRKSEEEFRRLGVKEISDTDNAVARAVRLAPSARNTQPWQLSFGEDGLTIGYQGRGLFKGLLKKKLSKIDLGIAAKCAELALVREGKEIKSISVSGDDNGFAVSIIY
jgi:arsenate reductase-like glutaredoxin family protein